MVRPGLYDPAARGIQQQQQDRSLGEFARHGAAANESIAVTAFSKMSEMHERALDRIEKDRGVATAPAETMKDFFKEQQVSQQAQIAEERRREEQRRTDEREANRQREADREAQHRRDMDRIKAENDARLISEKEARQTLLELEKAKMDVIREENRAREAVMKAELDRVRSESKEDRATLLAQLQAMDAKAEERIAGVEASVAEEIKKDRATLDREYDLRKQAMENDRKHNEDMLKLREEMLKNQNGDETTKMIGKLVEGLERTVKEVVELKKIEAVSAEGHLAKVGQGGGAAPPADVNISAVNPNAGALPAPQEQSPAMQPASGNGHSHKPADAKENESMDSFVRQMSQDPFFQEVLKEWSLHVKLQADATTFTNMFMEWMRDDGTMEGAKARKACAVFVNHMQVRDWPAIHALLKPAIPAEYRELFESPHATVFYDQFRLLVVESVKDYWRAYAAAKQAEAQAAQAAAASAKAAEKNQEPARIPAVPAVSVR